LPQGTDRIGVLVAQLGTPDAPTPAALRRYLRQFLGDPRVVERNRLLWWFILRLLVLPRRPHRSAALYKRIWTRNGDTPQYELSRQRLLSSPTTGGLVPFAAAEAAYMPMAGNDLSFATPPQLDGDPVVAPLSVRCATCHGSARAGVGHMMTFSRHTVPGQALPHVERLNSTANPHASSVAMKKMEQENYKALRALWR